VADFKCGLFPRLLYPDTFGNIEGGSETMINNINIQLMFTSMSVYANAKYHLNVKSQAMTLSSADCYLAKSIYPDMCLTINNRLILCSEVKGIEASIRECYSQLISVCGSTCIVMRRLGIPIDDCIVPGIAMAGSQCQFVAAYLLEGAFPLLVALSPILDLFQSSNDCQCIAE